MKSEHLFKHFKHYIWNQVPVMQNISHLIKNKRHTDFPEKFVLQSISLYYFSEDITVNTVLNNINTGPALTENI